MENSLGRAQALALLEEWTKGESLRKHGLAVSVCVEAYGRIGGGAVGIEWRGGGCAGGEVCVRGFAA